MLMTAPRRPNLLEPPPMHYLDSAQMLSQLRAAGHSLGDMARLTGLTIPQLTDRLRLLELDEGLRTYLRRENVPERIALTLLLLPDAVSRRRLAHRIVRERLCIRDAALLVLSARRNLPRSVAAAHTQRVITLIRDVRPFRNALRDIAAQMQTAGLRATFIERKTGGMQELTIAYPARRRRSERHQAM